MNPQTKAVPSCKWSPRQVEKLARQINHLESIERKRGLSERSRLSLFIMKRRHALATGVESPMRPEIKQKKLHRKYKKAEAAAPIRAYSCNKCGYSIEVLSLGHRNKCPKCHHPRGFYHCFPDLAEYANQ